MGMLLQGLPLPQYPLVDVNGAYNLQQQADQANYVGKNNLYMQAQQEQAAQNQQYAQYAGMIASMLMMSSAALKDDVQPVEPEDALQDIKDTKVSRWRYKHETEFRIGPLAEQTPFSTGVAVDYGSMTGSLVAAVQALTSRLEKIEDAIAATETQATRGESKGLPKAPATVRPSEATAGRAA